MENWSAIDMVAVGFGLSGTFGVLSSQEARTDMAQIIAGMIILDVFIGFKFNQ